MLRSDSGRDENSGGAGATDLLRFGVLGPLEVIDEGGARTPTAPRLRTLLALMLMRANTVVSHSELAEELWGADPPDRWTNTIQVFVRRIRRLLCPGLGPSHPDQRLRTSPAGYTLCMAADQLDLSRFERLAASGRRAARDGDPEGAAKSLRAALAVWRGPALADVPVGSVLQPWAVALEEARLAALEEGVEVELRMARHRELVAELRALTEQHPLREAFWRQLMVALCRSERRAEALDAYQRLRNTLTSELGVEPGAEVRQVQHAILAGDPTLNLGQSAPGGPLDQLAVSEPAPMAQLPADIGDFIGREAPLAEVRAALRAGHSPTGNGEAAGAPPVVVISGRGGVGKSVLAMRAAHACRATFPDGQLYANLRGTACPADVLARFLRALGCDGAAIPDSLEERADSFRSRLADRRVLVVLDDVADESQVRPLLPGDAGCAVMVTSRRRLAGLEGAAAVDLPLFAPDDAIELLARLAGGSRLAADRDAAERITELCGLLPLALRVAGAKLSARPHWSAADLAHRLADERSRLGELWAGDLDVRASFTLSYQACGPAERRAFRLLTVAPSPDFPAWVAAAACDMDAAAAEAVVERLVDARLLDVAGRDEIGQLRYQFHDLLRVFAAERREAEESDSDHRAAVGRVLSAYRDLARAADEELRPGRIAMAVADQPAGHRWAGIGDLAGSVARDPVGWFGAERASLIGVVAQAHTAGMWPLVWTTAQAAVGFFDLRSYWDDWRQVTDLALDAARRAGDEYAATLSRYDLGLLHADRDRAADAAGCLAECIEAFERLGRTREAALARSDVAIELLDERRADEALEQAHRALDMLVECGDLRGEALASRAVGNTLRHLGRLSDAMRYLDRSLDLFRALGDRRWEAYLLLVRAGVRELRGEVDRAGEEVAECLTILRALDDRRWEGFALRSLGDIRRRQGSLGDAAACYRRALAIMRRLGDRRSEGYLAHSLGDLFRVEGRLTEAQTLLEHSLEIFVEFDDPRGRPLALLALGAVARADRRHAEAVDLTRRSLDLLRKLSMPLWEARALTDLGEALAAAGGARAARRRWREALAIFREIGVPDAERVETLLSATSHDATGVLR